MAVERIFDEADVIELLEQNAAPPHGHRNAALIMAGVYWGLTPLELSLVATEDVMASTGDLYRVWTLPAQHSYNGESREIHTEDHVLVFFEKYVTFRLKKKWLLSNLGPYKGLAHDRPFFLNDLGQPYKITARKSSPDSYQPRSINEKLKSMISKTSLYGATPASFRNSFVKGLHDNGCGWSDLKKVTGIKQKRALERIVRPNEREL